MDELSEKQHDRVREFFRIKRERAHYAVIKAARDAAARHPNSAQRAKAIDRLREAIADLDNAVNYHD